MRSIILVALFSFFLEGCGKVPRRHRGEPVTPPDTNTPTDPGDPPEKKLVLRMFGAKPCGVCKTAFPEILAGISAELPLIQGEVYVPVGENWQDAPSDTITKDYRDHVNKDFAAVTDEGWAAFRLQVQKDRKLPGIVVLDMQGNVLRVFKPGPTTFIVPEIVTYIKGIAK